MRTKLLSIAFVLLATEFVSAKTIVDSFTSGPGTLTTPVEGSNRPFNAQLVQEGLSDVLGGRRTLALSDASGTMDVVTDDGGSLSVLGGAGEEYKVIYGELFGHPLNLDLTGSSTSVLTVDINEFRPPLQGTETLRLILRTNALPIPTGLLLDVDLPPTAIPGPRHVSFPLSELSGDGNLADVDTITLQYSTVNTGFEFEINEIALVPEPSTSILVAVGGLIVLLRSRAATSQSQTVRTRRYVSSPLKRLPVGAQRDRRTISAVPSCEFVPAVLIQW